MPMFLLVIVGATLNKCKKVNKEFTVVADWLVFKVALPIMLFLEIASSEFSSGMDGGLISFCIISVTVGFLVITIVSVFCIRDVSKRGAFIQGACRSNVAIIGLPIAEGMFGDVGVKTIAVVIPFIILMFNVYSVIVMSIFSSSSEHKMNAKTVRNLMINIITNPLIIAVICGGLVMISGIEFPLFVNSTLKYLGNLATPLSLISLGASFRKESLKGRLGYAITAASIKTIVLPLVFVTIAVFLGYRGPALGSILICFAAPTAASSYIMAKKMDNDHELAGQILILSIMMCIITVFIGIFILKTLSLI